MTGGPVAAAAVVNRSAVTYCGVAGVPTGAQVGESIAVGCAGDPAKLAGKYAVGPTTSSDKHATRTWIIIP